MHGRIFLRRVKHFLFGLVLDLFDDIIDNILIVSADGDEHFVLLDHDQLADRKTEGLDLVNERLLIARIAVDDLAGFTDA